MKAFDVAVLFFGFFAKFALVGGAHLRSSHANATGLGKHVTVDSRIALPSWASHCTAIYLDLGSSIGVQIRKMFEPAKYAGATVIPLFDQYFGPEVHRRQSSAVTGICALGFEPNPVHYDRLDQLEAAYLARGWNVHFFKAAVWSSEGSMTFTGVGDDPGHKDWGAKLKHPVALHHVDVEVPTVDIAAFVRLLPASSIKLMKMDIEGAEYECVSHMVKHNTLCANAIGAAFAEAHAWGNTTHWVGERNLPTIKWHIDQQQGCTGPVTHLIDLDDESYLHDVDNNFASP